jgi:hypothetical protein
MPWIVNRMDKNAIICFYCNPFDISGLWIAPWCLFEEDIESWRKDAILDWRNWSENCTLRIPTEFRFQNCKLSEAVTMLWRSLQEKKR